MHFVDVNVDESHEGKTLALAGAAADLSGADRSGDGGTFRMWFASEGGAAACVDVLRAAGFDAHAGAIADENWNANWQQTWQPVCVGRTWYLSPPWDTTPTPASRLRLDLRPGVAFGNGDHPATHLCLELMEELVLKGRRFLDVGCGSGLLMEAAGKSGAAFVAGCDIDAAAVREAHAFGAAFAGSVDSIVDAAFDMIVANIQLGVLLRILPELWRIRRPGGHLVLSGILTGQADALREEFTGEMFCLTSSESGDWGALLVGERPRFR